MLSVAAFASAWASVANASCRINDWGVTECYQNSNRVSTTQYRNSYRPSYSYYNSNYGYTNNYYNNSYLTNNKYYNYQKAAHNVVTDSYKVGWNNGYQAGYYVGSRTNSYIPEAVRASYHYGNNWGNGFYGSRAVSNNNWYRYSYAPTYYSNYYNRTYYGAKYRYQSPTKVVYKTVSYYPTTTKTVGYYNYNNYNDYNRCLVNIKGRKTVGDCDDRYDNKYNHKKYNKTSYNHNYWNNDNDNHYYNYNNDNYYNYWN